MIGQNLRHPLPAGFGQFRIHDAAVPLARPSDDQAFLRQFIDHIGDGSAGDEDFSADLLQRVRPFILQELQNAKLRGIESVAANIALVFFQHRLVGPGQCDVEPHRLPGFLR